MKYLNRIVLFSFLLAFIFALSVSAQNTEQQKKEAALDGYCPVAYAVMHKPLKGNPKFYSIYEGKTYNFADGKAKEMFDGSPKKYIPKYDGYCAAAMSMGKKLKSNPKLFSIYKSNTYLFSTKEAKAMFDKEPDMYVKKADKEFAALNK